MRQRTIGQEVSIEGIGIHTGARATLRVVPAPDDFGIRFRRVDLAGAPEVPARAEYVEETRRCTRIAKGEASVSTIEHVMAAMRGLEIDNALIEIDGPEVPIADGSAQPFVEILEKAGIVEQGKERRILAVTEPIWVRSGNRLAVALPYDGFRVSFTFTNDHNHPVIGDLFAEFDIDPVTFRREIAAARTIGWLSELEVLKAKGLAQGATMEAAVVFSPTEVLTPMRFDDEPVRHKILDTVGDLYLAGFLHAHIVAVRSAHALNYELTQAILASESLLEMR